MEDGKMRRILVLTACGALGLFLATGGTVKSRTLSRTEKAKTERSFKMVRGGSVSLSTNLGNISVEPSADTIVTMELVLKGDKKDIARFHFDSNDDPAHVELRGTYHSNGQPMDLDIQFILRIPEGFVRNLELESGAGSLILRNVQANSIRGATAAGEIKVDDVLGRIDLKVGAGPIRAHVRRLNDDMRLATDAGEIRIVIPDTISADIDASTTGAGGVAFTPMSAIPKLSFQSFVEETTHLRGRIHKGGPKLKAKSGAGNVYLEIQSSK